ncbi:cation-transporting P-type ATPase [Natronospira bacteriovora]|uniref:Cation-transporting P-type ATPase n=1 Tax=Natronospira bacteriovora TaxID=3069753 RepID=A0ABU0W4C9_9GAMM|nr:cation-transporting P-type ATPase [Natronospira sp. AB-CW4]MDQ2068826.1 cation-transporting P-type ATPase [Natronospira sp. AB-CW4]
MPDQENLSFHSLSVADTLAHFETREDGLSDRQVAEQRERHGENRLPEPRRRGPLMRLLLQFHNVLIYVLMVAGAITILLQHWVDAAVIFGVVVINALIGFIQEGRAEQAMNSIRRMLRTRARVRREGEMQEIDAVELVPGDIVLLESGDRVPADLRLIHARGLRTDESSLTGESVPVDKQTEPVEADTLLAEQTSMAWSGTLVASGQARGVVVATGERSEIGRISRATESVEAITTPLLKKIHQFGRQLTVVILILAALTFSLGVWWREQAMADMFFAAVGLAVAAIPEGLPAIITITLALGVQAMASRQAIVRRLPAVETLGSVTVICSDKTGTLTRNEMTVRGLRTAASQVEVSGGGYVAEGSLKIASGPDDDRAIQELLLAATLCNESELRDDENGRQISGDPMEAALLVLTEKSEQDPRQLRRDWPRTDNIPFESERRYMASLHHDHKGNGRILLKGAPELVLSLCRKALGSDGEPVDLDHDSWEDTLKHFSEQGQRTLALAMKSCASDKRSLEESDVETGLVLLGVVGLEDPPRKEAIDAVRDCQQAGIRVKMITGDHLGTAMAIGRQMGIGDGRKGMSGGDFQKHRDEELADFVERTDIYARFSPEDKLRLVRALREQKQVTAMTGDGVNDAPALRSADVGVAMGQKGTETAREASEIVLADDNFATIASAVRIGRGIYDNIRKSLLFILPTNGGQAMLILVAVMLGLSLPVTPVQVLWVNMVTAVTLALALAFEPAEPDVMQRPPRPPGEPILTPFLVWRVVFVSFLILAATFWVFHWHLDQGYAIEVARTAAVNTVVACEIFYLFNCRYLTRTVFARGGLFGNPWVPGAILLVMALQAGFTWLPFMQQLFQTEALSRESMTLILAVSLPVLFVVELEKWLMQRQARAALKGTTE